MELPSFRYHPDPVRSGSIEESRTKCRCCSKARGYIYTGPVYCEEELEGTLCPWCIADGTAHQKFDAAFVDQAIFPEDIPPEAVEEISFRTPGYSAWQTEHWFSCCDDAMAFLEPVGIAEIRARHAKIQEEVLSYIVSAFGLRESEARGMLESLHRDQGPTAYLFQCLHCGRQKVFVDAIYDIEA